MLLKAATHVAQQRLNLALAPVRYVAAPPIELHLQAMYYYGD